MTITELIEEILNEWAYRVENGMPDPKNPIHVKELGIVLSEMGLSHIKNDLVENLLMEKGKTPEKHVVEADKKFSNPILSKKVSYKDKDGNAKDGIVGNLLRLPKDSPGRVAAEKLLPPEGSPERDAMNKDLGGEGQPKKPEDEKGKEGGEEAPKEDPAKAAAAMFDPKADPAMAARMDREKDANAKLAKDAEADKEVEKEQEPKKEDEFNPIDSKDVAKEMPQADPETFNGDSDIPDGIEPEDLEKFNTDISKVQQIVADAKAKGEKAPDINLCDITVPGTNLYCDDNLGIPRDQMPQFKGKPQPGTPAADMEVDEKGEVDTEPLFKKMLEEKGIKVVQTEIPSDKLKATQKDLVGAKVVGMMGALEENPEHPSITAPIYVSRDGYVIDGHHRWAAIAAYNAKYPDKQIPMKVQVIDQDIKDAIPMCNKFAEEQGVAAKKADANKEGPSEQPNAAKEKTKEETTKVANDLKGRTTSEGEELDVDTTDNGSLIIGVEHGDELESTNQTIEQIQKLPKDTKVMFVGEGGMSKDKDGNIQFGGEQAEIRDGVKGHFDNAEESSWDENANIEDDKSQVFKEIEKELGSPSKSRAAIWTNMVGQGDNLKPNEYLDDEGKQWIIDQAKKAGATNITDKTDFNNLTDEEKKDLYELNYNDEGKMGDNEIMKGQEAYNGFRQKELDRKIKEAEDNGYTVIAPVGNSHVDMRRQRTKKAGATPTSSSTPTSSTPTSTPSTTPTQSSPTTSTPSTPTSAPKLTDKVKQKISNWTEKEKAFFERNEGAPGSKERRSLGQALKDKAAGALKAIKKGAKHEVEEFKAAGSGVKNFFSGKPLSKHEQKALKAVAFKVVTTAVFGAAFGGLSHGVAAFGKHVAMEFIPHIIGETILKGAGKAAVFADADGEAETDANVLKFTEMIAKGLEEMEITPEMMEQMVDSYNEKKENGEIENETPEVKAEHLHLVDELMLEMIYGFIEEAKGETFTAIKKDTGETSVFKSKKTRDAAVKKGTHTDVDGEDDSAEQPKNEPVAGADLFKGDYEKERGTGKKKKAANFKDSYLNNSKAAKSEKAQEDFEKRRQKALSQIDKAAEYNSDTPGVFRLETEEGSGKFIEIKTEDVKIAINKLFNGEKLSANDKKILNLTTKIVTNPENGDVKLYFAKKIAGRQPQQGYESVLMAEKNIPMGDAFREYAIENGLKVGKSGEGAFGKKQINPNKVAKGGNPKEPIKNLKVKSDKNGIEVNGQRFNYKPIPTKSELNKLREKLLKKGLSLKEADERIRILVNTRKKENQVLATIAEVAAKSGGEIPYCNFGDVFTPEGRKATITNVITGVTKMFTDGLNNHQNTFNTENLLEKPENKKVFDTLKRLEKISKSSNLETDKEAQLAFKKELDQLLIDMAESVDFKDSVADFAEMVVGLGSLAEGKRVMFPSSENFQTADIIILPSGESISDADLVNVSIEELDLTGGVSIKSDGGGGSALKNRIELTEYKNPKTKGKLLNALNTYQTAYGNQQDVKEEELVKGEAIIEDLFKHGIEMGCFTKQDIQKIKKIGEKQGQSEIKTAGDAGNCGGKENQKRLHRAMILQHQQMQLTCIISNCDTDWTGYSNVNKKYSKKKGKVVKVTDDIADGVKKPCYSNPHHNPGYTKSVDKNGCVSLTPSNQNPAHIVSKIPDLINNFKE